ncbi:hypothetical protein PAMP_002610 [Pampus punctatissimus]
MSLPNTKRNAFRVTTGIMSCLIFPENRAVERPMRFASAGSSPQMDRAPAIETHNGTVSSNNNVTPKQRPSVLGVTSKNGYVKTLREDFSDNEGGSLPSTPELPSDSELDEILEKDTRQLLIRFLRDFTGISKPGWCQSKALSTMKRVVEDLLEKHIYSYNGMINKLSLEDRGDDVTFISAVAKSLFADGTTNWGRVASLVAFGAVVCQNFKESGRENCVELVGHEISTYLLTDQRDWLVKNNAWDGFVEFFRVTDPESTVRNTLMAFAGFAGIGATLALLIR